jgi:60 kDa SS-A/Ro ribonucleoprotein
MNFSNHFSNVADRRNYHGFKTFEHSLRDRVRNFLRTGTLTGTFYVGAVELSREMINTLQHLGAQDPIALSEEAISAREEGYMRTLPVLATVVLSGLPNKQLFRKTARGVFKIPRDVVQFIEICKSGAVPGVAGFGGCRVDAAREWIETMSEYHAVKGFGSKTMVLRDAVRLTHPHPRDQKSRELLGWLSGHVPGKRVCENTMVVALELLKCTSDPAEHVQLIRKARLPYEVVTTAVANPSREVWVELLRNAPTMNLLMNLVTFNRHGVFTDEENVSIACEKLSRPDALRSSRILPFQAYRAWKMYSEQSNADPRIIAALSDALENSVANMPLFGGRVCLAPDVSGSMQGFYVNEKQTISAAEVSGIFAAGLLKRCPNVTVLPFESRVVNISLNPRDSVLANAQTISSLGGGGTSLSAPVERLLRNRDKVDLFVGITDNEEWIGRGFLETWHQYVREVSPEAKAVLITVVPTSHSVAPESEPGMYFVHGWSDAVLRYVAEIGGVAMTCDEIDEATAT